jgi:phospholipase/lecithinase/hemolysin
MRASKVPISGKPEIGCGEPITTAYEYWLRVRVLRTRPANSLTFNIGKATDNPGPMDVEVLAGLLRSSARPANQVDGTNYATSGAKNVNVNTPLNGGFPNAVPTATQISSYISSHPTGIPLGAANDLFVVDSGANDIDFALSNLSGFTTDQQDAYIVEQATALAGAIRSLQLNGATHIIVVGRQESFGNFAFQRARTLYDTTLRNALNAQQVPYAWADRNQVRKDIVANPATFNIQFFTNDNDQVACPPPDPVLNITSAWSLLCSANSPVTQPTAFADQTLFADDQHFSAAAQNVLGTYLFCLTRLTWPQFGLPVPRPLALAVRFQMSLMFRLENRRSRAAFSRSSRTARCRRGWRPNDGGSERIR